MNHKGPSTIWRVRRFNVEQFMGRRRRRMWGAVVLSLIFVLVIVWAVARFLGGVL